MPDFDWKEVLEKAKRSTTDEQIENAKEIVEAFRAMWDTKPSEEEFSRFLTGVVAFPQISYIMATNPFDGRQRPGE